MSTSFPELFQFLAGYFHQDWNCEYDSEDNVVRSFISDSSKETISQVKIELQTLLIKTQNEEELKDILFNELSCYYYYPYAWSSGKAWLEHVLSMLSPR